MSPLDAPPSSPRRRRVVRLLIALTAAGVVTLALVGARSWQQHAGARVPEVSARERAPGVLLSAVGVPVEARVTRVAGRLDQRGRRAVEADVARLVEGYLTAAFLDPSRRQAPAEAFPGFTARAAAEARSQAAVLTAGDFAPEVALTPRRARAFVAVVSSKDRPSGATATLDVLLAVADRPDRPVRLSGRLLLTPAADGWRVFGFDLARSGPRGDRGPGGG